MGDFMKISEASRVLDVPASKLRYWERKGLISFARDEENDYRRFDFQSLVDVTDVMFAREVGMPISELKGLRNADIASSLASLDALEKCAAKQITSLERRIDAIHAQRDAIQEWVTLENEGIRRGKARLRPVYEFDFFSEEKVRLYIDNPNDAVDIIPCNGSREYQYGRFMDDSEWRLQRSGDSVSREYLIGPLWMNGDRETNIAEFVQIAASYDLTPGSAICQFLSSGSLPGKGFCYQFKAYLEIE